MFFGQLIHDICPRRFHFYNDDFAQSPGMSGCLLKVGCKGVATVTALGIGAHFTASFLSGRLGENLTASKELSASPQIYKQDLVEKSRKNC
ncbi:hypothetical protein HKBW3S03_02143, partial [Candidatus Hakubella thermalkaliphila]